MSAYLEILTKNSVDGSSNLEVYCREKSAGVFIIQPVGPINTITSLILEKKAEQILGSKPDVLVFDMSRVDYINTQGLRIIFKVYQALKPRGGRVALIKLRPHIKKVFEIIMALPNQQIFTSRHELDNYLYSMQSSCSDYSYLSEFEAGTDHYINWAENNLH